MKNLTKGIVISNFIWRFLERFGAQGVTLIVSIVLARILDPTIYGIIALVTIFTTILQVFIDSGLGTALIQKKEVDSADFSTVFYFNLIICILLYFILFLLAPAIAKFYNIEDLIPIIRVLGLLLIISGFKNIQNAYVSRHLMFKKYFFATLSGTISAAIIGIFMAYKGYGVWALVVQNLVNQFIDTIVLWIIVKWKPTLEFSFNKLKVLLNYGWKLLASSLLDTIWNEVSQLIIGKKYTKESLAYYNKGQEYPKYAASALNSSIDSILLPVMSGVQEDKEKVKQITKRAIKTGSFFIFPIMIGLTACANTFTSVILTDKWLFIVPFLRIFCIEYAFYPIQTANLNVIKSIGRSDIFLKLEIIKKILGTIILFSTMWNGSLFLAIGTLISTIISYILNTYPNKKLINYGCIEQIKDMMPVIIISVIMGILVYFIGYITINNVLLLIVQICSGIIIYSLSVWLFKIEAFNFSVDLIKSLLNKLKK